MTGVIVEVGPGTIRGPNDVRTDWVSAALECIDDDLTLIDDRPVSVAEVWQDVLGAAVGGAVDTVLLVCPAWWSSSRIDVVCEAAGVVAANIEVLHRSSALREGLADRVSTVVEIASEFVVVSAPDADMVTVPRRDDPVAVAEAVADQVSAAPVVVDASMGIEGAASICAAVVDRLHANGIAVSAAGQDCVRRGAALWLTRQQSTVPNGVDDGPCARRGRRAVAVTSGATVCVAALCGGFVGGEQNSGSPSLGMPVALLVEGRVAVKVPVQWAVQRITAGPGSARVQVVSPSDSDVVVHITQSSTASPQTLAMVADTLRAALAHEPVGVFVDFNADDRRADKPAVTYRENRADHQVAWTVILDDEVRIAIGCQSGPGREQLVRDVCEQAIQSAHAVF